MSEARVATYDRVPSASAELRAIAELFRRLHEAEIGYCHWKSNEHLALSMIGMADLDVLVDRRATLLLAAVLAELGFKRLLAGPGRGYPGIEDYVGFDVETGRLVHLHLHYRLTLGEKHLKGYRLPWESVALSSRTLDGRFGVYVADPNLEMLLLLVRLAMKVRTRDRLSGRSFVRGSALAELRWLAARVDPDRLNRIASELVGERAARVVMEIAIGAAPTLRRLRELRRAADPSWREYRMYAPWEASSRRWLREGRYLMGMLGCRFARLVGRADVHSCARTPAGGGMVVALVGPDGAGKSTIAAELIRWLSREVAVVSLYGGSGSGPASLPRLALQRGSTLARPRSRLGTTGSRAAVRGDAMPSVDTGRRHTGVRALGYALWALSLAAERRRNVGRARRARDRGKVVVADRYPQTQFLGLNDGPKLDAWRDHWLSFFRWAAALERAAFRSVDAAPPDLVVKLKLPADIALQRKPDTPPDRLRRKVEIVALLQFPATTRVVDVDATEPLDQVLLRVKHAVWESL
jgi:thymidylate kinase